MGGGYLYGMIQASCEASEPVFFMASALGDHV